MSTETRGEGARRWTLESKALFGVREWWDVVGTLPEEGDESVPVIEEAAVARVLGELLHRLDCWSLASETKAKSAAYAVAADALRSRLAHELGIALTHTPDPVSSPAEAQRPTNPIPDPVTREAGLREALEAVDGEVEARIAINAERVQHAIKQTDSLPDAADNLIRSMKRTCENLRPSIVNRLRSIESARALTPSQDKETDHESGA